MECELCNLESGYELIGTSFHGPYCQDCLELTMKEDREAMANIKKQKRNKNKKEKNNA